MLPNVHINTTSDNRVVGIVVVAVKELANRCRPGLVGVFVVVPMCKTFINRLA